MGHKNKESLVKQCENVLLGKLKIGESKHNDKILGITDSHIYSWKTFKGYLQISCRFLSYTKENYGCKTLEEARQYANEWLHKWDSSPYTQKTYVAALCKLYGEHAEDFIKTKNRERANIQRSRNDVVRKMEFAGDNKVWGRVHSCADIHSYRREYCHRVYSLFARPIDTLKPNEKYICRKDKQGIVYDRLAMKMASEALGHSRITVIAEHYL